MNAWYILIASAIVIIIGRGISMTGDGNGANGLLPFAIGWIIVAGGIIVFLVSLGAALFH